MVGAVCLIMRIARRGAVRFIKNPTLWIVVLLAAIFNESTAGTDLFSGVGERGWAFEQLPAAIGSTLSSAWVIVGGIGLLIVKAIIDIMSSHAMFQAFKGHRVSLLA